MKVLLYSFLCSNTAVFAEDTKLNSLNDYFQLSIEELLNIPITSTSFFADTSLNAGSTVTVLTPEYWQKRGARRLEDALQYLPGVSMAPSFLGAKNMLIRGFPNSNGTGVQTLWDGVPINTYPIGNALIDRPNIQLNTLDSIEVIRGPGSALYGSDAFTGVLSLNSFESISELNQLQLQGATNGYYNAAFKTATKLSKNTYINFSISGNGQPDQNSNYEYTSAGNTLSSERDYLYDSYTSTLKLFSDQDKKFSYKVGLYLDNYVHNGFFHNGTDVPAKDLAYMDNNMGMYKAEAKWRISKNKSLTYDMHQWDSTHVFSRILPNLNRIYIFNDEKQSGQNITYRDEDLLPDTQMSFAIGHRRNDVKNAGRRIITPGNVVALDAALLFNDSFRHIYSYLLDAKTTFGKGDYVLRYGFRRDEYSDFGNHIAPRLGLIKKVGKNSVVKLLYGDAFRAPSANELYGGPIQTGDLNLKPEEIDTVELVYLFENSKRKTEVVLFQSELKNSIQLVDAVAPEKDYFANVGAKNTAYGIEVSHYQVFDEWQLDTSASHSVSRNDTDGYNYGTFPLYIINLGVGYKFKNDWLLFVNNRVHFGVDREPNTTSVDSSTLPDYWRMDFSLSKKYNKKIEFFSNIRNLFNKKNELASLQNSVRSDQFKTGIQDEEISFDIGLRYKF